MDPLGLLGGVASLIGGNQANVANARQAQLNRDFQERMSNTSWQRGVADMRAAGINPALAYSQGGASQPGGGQATNMQDVVTPAISTAMQAFRTRQELGNMKEQRRLTGWQADKAREETTAQAVQNAVNTAESGAANDFPSIKNSIAGQRAITALNLARAQATSAASIARKADADAAISRVNLPAETVYGSERTAYARLAMEGINSAVGAFRAVKAGKGGGGITINNNPPRRMQ